MQFFMKKYLQKSVTPKPTFDLFFMSRRLIGRNQITWYKLTGFVITTTNNRQQQLDLRILNQIGSLNEEEGFVKEDIRR